MILPDTKAKFDWSAAKWVPFQNDSTAADMSQAD